MSFAWSRWASACARLATALLCCAFSASTCRCASLQVRLRALQRSLLLMQLRGVLLGVLNGAVAGLLQMLVARRLLLREHQRRLRLIHLRLVGADLRLLHVELRLDVLDAGPRGPDLGLRLFERDAIVALVDAGNHVPGGDMLVVGDRDGGEIAGHFRRERRFAAPR